MRINLSSLDIALIEFARKKFPEMERLELEGTRAFVGVHGRAFEIRFSGGQEQFEVSEIDLAEERENKEAWEEIMGSGKK